jgi:hypothetical protein
LLWTMEWKWQCSIHVSGGWDIMHPWKWWNKTIEKQKFASEL